MLFSSVVKVTYRKSRSTEPSNQASFTENLPISLEWRHVLGECYHSIANDLWTTFVKFWKMGKFGILLAFQPHSQDLLPDLELTEIPKLFCSHGRNSRCLLREKLVNAGILHHLLVFHVLQTYSSYGDRLF